MVPPLLSGPSPHRPVGDRLRGGLLHVLRLDGPFDRATQTLAAGLALLLLLAGTLGMRVRRLGQRLRLAGAAGRRLTPSAPPADAPRSATTETGGRRASTAPVGSLLYRHRAHPHHPQNVNALHHARHQQSGFNRRLAVLLTRAIGTMSMAYLFGGIGIGSLIGVFTNNVFLAAACGSFSSYFLQLVSLPVLAVGQQVLGQHAELQSEETYQNTVRANHEMLQVMQHLCAQDDELVRQTQLLLRLAGGGGGAAATSSTASTGAEQSFSALHTAITTQAETSPLPAVVVTRSAGATARPLAPAPTTPPAGPPAATGAGGGSARSRRRRRGSAAGSGGGVGASASGAALAPRTAPRTPTSGGRPGRASAPVHPDEDDDEGSPGEGDR